MLSIVRLNPGWLVGSDVDGVPNGASTLGRWCDRTIAGVPSDETRTVSHWSLGGRGTVKGSDTESEAMDLTVSIDDMLTRFSRTRG
jgi:hypothetical protein